MNRFAQDESSGNAMHRLLNGLGGTQIADTVRRDVEKGVRSADDFIGRNPLVCMSVAFVIGAAVAFWVKRK